MGWFSRWIGPDVAVAPEPLRAVVTDTPTAPRDTAQVVKVEPLDLSEHRRGRTVVVDCETTGFSWAKGDRIVSLAGIELQDGLPTGLGFSLVFNPERPSARGAVRVHGLPDQYLALQNPFSAHAEELRGFISDAPIVAHNASFDLGFLNNEFSLSGQPLMVKEPICTMWLYRSRFTGSASLDACCATYGLDRSSRSEFHGAFVDAALTAALFQGLTDNRQPPLHLVKVNFLAPTNAIGSPDEFRGQVETILEAELAGIDKPKLCRRVLTWAELE